MDELTDEEYAAFEKDYDKFKCSPSVIDDYECAIENITPGESAAIIDKYYDF